MPMYEYVCGKCGREFEVRQSMAEHTEAKAPPCPACGVRSAKQQLSTVNVAMNGGGGDLGSEGPSCSGGSCCCN